MEGIQVFEGLLLVTLNGGNRGLCYLEGQWLCSSLGRGGSPHSGVR